MTALFSALFLIMGAGIAPPAAPPGAPAEAPAAEAPASQCQTGAALAVAPGLISAEFVLADCQASCGGGTFVSCSGSACSAVDRNCPYQQGYVVCDGNYTYCQPACETGGCTTLFQCRQGCSCPGGISTCTDLATCSCECIYH